ncbi:MAG: ABC transporter ATP-binding protein [Bdellovibrionaceae bacterium]|nr:ABC transporter ATP-binding protein [Pseudobdellovibrionaceae bacterium]
MALIELSNVEFSYGQQPVLRIPRFTMEKGERLFLHGPSGSGKSTFLEILSGILAPQKGEVRVLGQDLAAMTSSQRDRFRADHIGSIFQSFNLIPYLNVRDNIALGPAFSSVRRKPAAELDKERDEMLKALGIDHLFDRPVTRLSVGQQQRVAVARALLGGPEIVLADEPTSALDEDHREKFLKLLFELAEARGTSLIFVSHDRSIQRLFGRVEALSSLNEVKA